MKQVKSAGPIETRPGHRVRLGLTSQALTSYSGLSLFYALAEALEIPPLLDAHVRVKKRERGYPESEHILALAANAFVGGDFLDDLEALRADQALKVAIGREELPDPTTAGDFCRRFTRGHLYQLDRAMGAIFQAVYRRRPEVTTWTLDLDAKVHEVHGAKKQGAAKAYNGVYSLQPFYAFVDETDELAHVELRAGNTHPGAKAVRFLRRCLKKKPAGVRAVFLRSDSALYQREVVALAEREGIEFTITADQTAPLLARVEALPPEAWTPDPEAPMVAYAECWYQPVRWPRAYRYLVRRRLKQPEGQAEMFPHYTYTVVVTNRAGEAKALLDWHDGKGTSEKRIEQFTNEILPHLCPWASFWPTGSTGSSQASPTI